MNGLIQGTTPTLTITIPEEIPVSTITAVELALKHNGTTTLYHIGDIVIDSEENSISKHFTETETLAFNPVSPITWQLRIQTPDGIFGTVQQRINVLDLISEVGIE